MSEADRKKAFRMLLGLEDRRFKSPSALAKLMKVSTHTSRRWWVEYFKDHNLPIPEYAEDSTGRSYPTSQRKVKAGEMPRISRDRRGYGKARVNGRSIHLPREDHDCQQKVNDETNFILNEWKRYESTSRIVTSLLSYGIHAETVMDDLTKGRYPGVYGYKVNSVVLTWDSFREKTTVVGTIGRALCVRSMVGAERVVVLCPVSDGPADLLELGRRLGVEWMTIEDFVASLKGAD